MDCILWKEIKQLQPQDQHHQQVKTDHSLAQTSPQPEELHRSQRTANINLIHGTDTISLGFATEFLGI